jgi:hypothetical protein
LVRWIGGDESIRSLARINCKVALEAATDSFSHLDVFEQGSAFLFGSRISHVKLIYFGKRTSKDYVMFVERWAQKVLSDASWQHIDE